MGRVLTVLGGLLLGLLIGVLLCSGPLPDLLSDAWSQLRVTWLWHWYTNSYMSFAGYALGIAAALAFLQLKRSFLKRGLLHSLRERLAGVRAAEERESGLLTAYGLRRFLERSMAWAGVEGTNRPVTVALFRVHGLDELYSESGALLGSTVLKALSAVLLESAVSRQLTGFARWWKRLISGPMRVLYGNHCPHRYPARLDEITLAMGIRGQPATSAIGLTDTVCRRMTGVIADIEGASSLRVSAAFAMRAPSGTIEGLQDAAHQAIEAATPQDRVVVAIDPADSALEVLRDNRELTILEMRMPRETAMSDSELDEEAAPGMRRWARDWWAVLGCLVVMFILILAGNRGERPKSSIWPQDVEEIQWVGASGDGVRTFRVHRSTAQPTRDATWQVDEAQVVQMDEESGQNDAQLRLEISNRSNRPQRLSLFDITAIDTAGRVLEVDTRASLFLEDALGARSIAPGDSWDGWLQFSLAGKPIEGLVIESSRKSLIFVRFPVEE